MKEKKGRREQEQRNKDEGKGSRSGPRPSLPCLSACFVGAWHSIADDRYSGMAWPGHAGCRKVADTTAQARGRGSKAGTCWYAHATMRRQRGAAFSDLSLSFPSGLTSQQTYIYLAVLSWFLLPVLENPDSGRWYIILSLYGDGWRSIDRLLPDIEDICLATTYSIYQWRTSKVTGLVCYGYGLALLLLERGWRLRCPR